MITSNAIPASPSTPVLHAQDVCKSYDQGAIPVLRGVSLSVHAAESVALCGPSGCGKSTLLHLFGGLDTCDQGSVWIDGMQLTSRTNMVPLLRHRIGFVFQLHNLIPDLTLRENCMIPALAAGVSRSNAEQRLRQLATATGIDHRLNQRIQKLSGGERQRTAICRALMNRPGILLADEPTGSLDEKNAKDVFDLLLMLSASEGVTLLIATHDQALARRCNRVLNLRDGRLDAQA